MEFNLETIKQEIESRRSSNMVNEQTTVNGRGAKGGQKFLLDILNSVNNNGAPTQAVQVLRQVTEVTDQKYGNVGKSTGQQYVPPTNHPSQIQQEQFPPISSGVERDDNYFEQQMQRNFDTLRQRSATPTVQQPAAGLSQILNEYAGAPYIGAANTVNNGGINANALNEHINKTMSDVMGGSNFTKIVEGAYKNMINEMYTKEKIETALVEIIQGDTFKKIMKKIVVDTLIEIQNRNKKSA